MACLNWLAGQRKFSGPTRVRLAVDVAADLGTSDAHCLLESGWRSNRELHRNIADLDAKIEAKAP